MDIVKMFINRSDLSSSVSLRLSSSLVGFFELEVELSVKIDYRRSFFAILVIKYFHRWKFEEPTSLAFFGTKSLST